MRLIHILVRGVPGSWHGGDTEGSVAPLGPKRRSS